MNNLSKDIFKIYSIQMDITSKPIMPFDSLLTKMLLTDLKGGPSWYLTPKNGGYKEVRHVSSYTSGLYCFWFNVDNEFHPSYLGKGKLSIRIPKSYYKLASSFDKLYVSFVKGYEYEKYESDYIKKLQPVFNKQHNLIGETFLNNTAAYKKVLNNEKEKQKKWKKEMDKLYKENETNSILQEEFVPKTIEDVENLCPKSEWIKSL